MSDDIQDKQTLTAVLLLFAAIAILISLDLVHDYNDGGTWLHIGTELFVLLVAAAGVGFLWYRLTQTKNYLAVALDEALVWRQENQELVLGLGSAIQSQFAQWALTNAETEVGLFLLKGLSHKEIASMRGTTERTAREQARALYRKSGLSGRSALSAFFLEDLLPNRSDESIK